MLKQSFISLSLACMLFSNANAGGIPTVDVAAIQQAVLNYNQMIKQYEQMVKDTLNFEKQMDDMGVNMSSVNEILGNTLDLVRDMQNLYDSIVSIPDDILGDVSKVQNACSFLESKSSYFKTKMNQINGIKNRVNRCSVAIANTANISKSIEDLMKQADKIADYDEYQKIMKEIENVKIANEFLQQKQNEENANRILAFYDTYKEENANNVYSQSKHNSDLRELSKALTKPNNQKQAQALTNSLLLKILESNHRQYEMNLEFYKTMTAFKMQEHKSDLTEESYQQTYTKPTINDKFLNYQYQDSQFETDSLGFPIITLDSVK